MSNFDVIIIGAGGAGMLCAINAGSRGRRVALLDHTNKIGKKILISGGGRCNFTNINAGPANYVSNNPHFCKSALSRYGPSSFIAMVERHKIKYHEKKLGQLFCDDSAQEIVNMLISECRAYGAVFKLNCRITRVSKENCFHLETTHGKFSCDSLVVATGGLSIPQTGATGFGYTLARQFGLSVVEPVPALDGFTFANKQVKQFSDLAGVSINSIVSTNGASFRENILFTHLGLSGPASLQASLYWSPGQTITIDLLPDLDINLHLKELRHTGCKIQLKNILAEHLPRRFADKLCDVQLPSQPINVLSDMEIGQISEFLHCWSIQPEGTVGFRKAEVTRGGVDTNELSSKSMETKKVPGLYFIGEVVDVTGWLGGYNFQWAWSSGYAAGQQV